MIRGAAVDWRERRYSARLADYVEYERWRRVLAVRRRRRYLAVGETVTYIAAWADTYGHDGPT
jgi:hypothetical protein